MSHQAHCITAPIAAARPVNGVDQVDQVVRAGSGPRPAGFGIRALAASIDFVILHAMLGMVDAVFLAVLLNGLNTTAIIISTVGSFAVGGLLTIVYWVWLESSPWQASIGKKILGLRVVDLDGRRIKFGQSARRTFAKSLSALILGIGYLMPLWNSDKQALHDKMARCLVVRRVK